MKNIFKNQAAIITAGSFGIRRATARAFAIRGHMFPLSKFQNLLSIGLGLGLIFMATMGMTGVRIPIFSNALVKLTAILKTAFSKYINHKSPGALLLLGSLNGLLPCGLTFLALTFCVILATPQEGFAYMFVFGIGTLPVMLGFVSLMDFVRDKMNWNIKNLTNGLIVLSGILLIARVFLIHTPDGHSHELDLIDIVICR